MNWVRELYDLYDKNQYLVGQVEKGRYQEDVILLPVFHTTVKAQVTLTIHENGTFLRANIVPEEDCLTIIPVTENSGGRTSSPAPHPLCDNLKYLAGDYMVWVSSEKYDKSKHYDAYLEKLSDWIESEYDHPKARAVYYYIKKGTLIHDLVACKILTVDERGLVCNEKIQKIDQREIFVRFNVISTLNEVDDDVIEIEDLSPSECWKDRTLFDSYINYCKNSNENKGLSYLTGEWTSTSYLQPKKIRNEGDGTKLISANDEKNFTYKGRFISKEEAFSIGYEDSQKIHNALKWIIRRQGKNWSGLSLVTWESDLNELPDWSVDTDTLCTAYETLEGWDDDGSETTVYNGTNKLDAARFLSVINGYGKKLDIRSKMVLMALDAATPGRLAVVEYQSLASSQYLDNLKKWINDCGWIHPKKGGSYYGMPGIKEIANLLYGSESDKGMELKGKNEKMSAEVLKRLIPCILSRKPVPEDMVQLSFRRASSPVSYNNQLNWDKTLALACSLIKKKNSELAKEDCTVSLNKERKDRNYLYGRLLAVADRIEYCTFDKGENRITNARRYMNAFSQQPFLTWKVIEERLQPYISKLATSQQLFYQHLIDEICWLFNEGDFECNDGLNGSYLLGYHNQAYALRMKNTEE